jgi:hypothetical protein
MDILLFLPYYFRWHYTRAWKNLFENWKNFILFVYFYFSIHVLLSTLFAPWRRLGEEGAQGFDPEAFLSAVIVNSLMRLVGFCVRLPVVLLGVCATLFVAFLGICASFIWLIFPVVLLFIASLSMKGLFSI